MRAMILLPLARALGLLGIAAVGLSAAATDGVRITDLGDRLRIEIQGELFTEYHYRDVSRPFLHPVHGPGQVYMTRHWPMRETADEARDHVHQRSLYYAHGDVNGHDFWSESNRAGKTVHLEFTALESGPRQGLIRSRNQLVTRDGEILCTDERTLRIYPYRDVRLFDFEITIHASHGELKLGDTKEGTMAIRVAESMRLKPNQHYADQPAGRIVNSEGLRDGATWGKRARWVDYHGRVGDRIVGVAIFDHPENPRHPTWWHVRDYGLFAANPFGIHDFERKPPGTGDMIIPAGESVTFRYRFYMHPGDEIEGRVAERYQEYVKATADR
jgi:hypothetical protein